MKQILFLKSAPLVPVTGADISMFERLELLRTRHGWESAGVSIAPLQHKDGLLKVLSNLNVPVEASNQSLKYTFKSLPVEILLDPGGSDSAALLKARVTAAGPQVLVANFRDDAALDIAVSNSKHVIFLTEDEYPRPGVANGDRYKKIQNVIVATEFLKQSLKLSWGIDATVLRNAVNTEYYRVSRSMPGEYITLLHPNTHKGIDIFMGIARSMPEEKFLIAGGVGEDYRKRRTEFAAIPNITHFPYQGDVRAVYQASWLVLVPSLWEEAFSRVIVEALAADLPVIASDRGGTREAGGDAAIYLKINPIVDGRVPEQDFNQWVDAIRKLKDVSEYMSRVELARSQTKSHEEALSVSLVKLDKMLTDLR